MSAAAVAVRKAQDVPQRAGEAMEMDAEGQGQQQQQEDLYTRLKTLQRQLEFLEIQASAAGALGGLGE